MQRKTSSTWLRRFGRLLFMAILVLSSQGAFVYNSWAESRITIGAILPLSGSGAAVGDALQKALVLAKEEKQDATVELIVEDDGWDVKRSVAAFRKLQSINNISAVIVTGSAVGNAIAPLAEKAKIPMIAIGASDRNIVKDRTFAFTHWVTPEAEAVALVDELVRRGYKRLGCVAAEHEGVLSVQRAITTELEKRGILDLLVYQQSFLGSETDFRTYVAKARQLHLDGVIVILFPGSIASFAKQVRAAALPLDLIGVELFEDDSEVRAADGALLGQWYVNAARAEESFVERYRSRYAMHPGWATANAFDAFNLLAAGLSLNGASAEKAAQHLKSLKDYRGVTGTYSATGDNRFRLPAAVMVVTETGFQPLDLSKKIEK